MGFSSCFRKNYVIRHTGEFSECEREGEDSASRPSSREVHSARAPPVLMPPGIHCGAGSTGIFSMVRKICFIPFFLISEVHCFGLRSKLIGVWGLCSPGLFPVKVSAPDLMTNYSPARQSSAEIHTSLPSSECSEPWTRRAFAEMRDPPSAWGQLHSLPFTEGAHAAP